MNLKSRLKPLGLVAFSALAISTLAAGCSAVKDAQSAACCKEFVVGTDMTNADFGVDVSIKGQFNAYAQATGDLSATATATLGDVTTACQNIALDLGADPADPSVVGKGGTDAASAWCALAVTQISANFGAKGTLSAAVTVDFTPPVCTASVQATASCEGSCDASAMCDVKANPPTCEGGTLSVDCKGDCTVKAGASIECTGSCMGNCSGSCKATGGATVACTGKCDGKCTADAASGGMGVKADGSCDGQCDGTCEIDASAPMVKCTGTCDGHCDATCHGTATASVKCSGTCNADYTPLKCEGGTLKASCMVDAHCEANCNASASAKAQCTPPSVSVTAAAKAGVDDAQLQAALNSLEANLPNLLIAFKGRAATFATSGQAAVTAGLDIAGSGKLGAKGTICAADIGIAIGDAVSNMSKAASAAGTVAGALKIGS